MTFKICNNLFLIILAQVNPTTDKGTAMIKSRLASSLRYEGNQDIILINRHRIDILRFIEIFII